jgi:DNA-binding NarL/FixJ family response regulator
VNEEIRVLIVDDQPLLRHSLRIIVEGAGMVVVGEAADGAAAIEGVRALRPDVVLMDIRMPGMDGIRATETIVAESPETRVLILSMFELDEYVYGALRAGASGFLLKDARPEQLVDGIRRTVQNESLFAPSILGRLVSHYLDAPVRRPSASPGPMTAREAEVLTLVGRGLANTEIADVLKISMGTVKTHIGNLLAKLQARDRAQLVIAAYEYGLVQLSR